MSRLRHGPDLADEFDYVIIGAGAAGCVLAARLSEDPATTVCLLEAGPHDRHPFISIPAGFTRMISNSEYTWQFATEPVAGALNRSIPFPQGRTLGGSTSLNGMVYTRGQPRDFDEWSQAGNPGWSYADVLPYFKRLENRPQGDPKLRGHEGELTVTDAEWRSVPIDSFIAAARAEGLEVNPDYNGKHQEGVAITQQTVFRGRRMSASAAFLRPTRGRTNLSIRTRACASRILFEGRLARGVAYSSTTGESEQIVKARREVIVSGGAFNTARLLQVSGIGNASLLREIGVDVVHDLPGVGENLQDHYLVRVVARAQGCRTINELSHGSRLLGQVARWALGFPSILAMCPSPVHFFVNSGLASGGPDLQGLFVPANYKGGTRRLDDQPGMSCAVWQHRPRSRGYVRARSKSLSVAPSIQPNYLSDEHDRAVLLAGIRFCRRLFEQTPLNELVAREIEPGRDLQSDAELLTYASRAGSTVYHPAGTARMGPANEPLSVVDHELRVHGIDNLRVIDASIMPTIPSGNTAAATMMIAEKGAAMIRLRR